ncbi:hypothetical protein [Brassicibacter mesophilus]|uniref:ATP-grasp domain-containing protein n=1 Tax=Brassicibacter mesophilus TaxID=745119 RepID=UPI003D25EBB8
MEKRILNKIIVLGGAHHNGLGIIRSLGENGIPVYFISVNSAKNYVTKSKYVKKSWFVSGEDEIIELLFGEFNGESHLPIIFPSDDYSARFLDKNLKELNNKFIFPHICNTSLKISELMDKDMMNHLVKKLGFKIPNSMLLDFSRDDKIIIEDIMSIIGLPCIIKPTKSVDGTKSDIVVINDRVKLYRTLVNYKKKYKELLVQQYVNKSGEIGIQGISTFNSNNVFVSGIVEKIRVSTIAPGSTTYAKIVGDTTLLNEDKIISLVKSIGFKGIFDIEFMYDNSYVYFIEMNFRNGAYGYAFTKAGINLPELWIKEAIGESIEKCDKKVKKTVKVMSEIADFRNVLDRKISLSKWFLEFIKTDVHLILNWRDVKPFLFKLIYRI